MPKNDLLPFIGCDREFKDADIVIFGAPFDGTVSHRPGARFAPLEIRRESYALETYSPYQDKDLDQLQIADAGDLELPFGDSKMVLKTIEKEAERILSNDKIPFMLGGEHLVTLGAVPIVANYYPGLCLIHFDAHTDLRNDYLGVKLSHACVVKRCHEVLGDDKIYQFGIRSGDKSEFSWQADNHTYMEKYSFATLEKSIAKIKGCPVYLSVDLDVLDPSVLPGTGTPEPGGVSFDQLRKAVTTVCGNCYIVGCDVCELSPPCDSSNCSTAVAAKIIREMLIALA